MTEMESKIFDVLIETKFGMIEKDKLKIIDSLYSKLKETAIDQKALINFGQFIQAEKFYFYWRDRLICFSLFKTEQPFYTLEVVENTHYPFIKYAGEPNLEEV